MATLEQINENVLSVKKELDDIKEIEASRKRPATEFKTQEYMEKKFL